MISTSHRIFARSIYISSKAKKPRSPETLIKKIDELDLNYSPQRIPQVNRGRSGRKRTIRPINESRQLEKKILQIERLATALQREVETKEDLKLQQQKLKELGTKEGPAEEEEIDAVLGLLEDEDASLSGLKTSLFEVSQNKVPKSIADRVGSEAVAQYVADERHQDWNSLVTKLENQDNGLEGVTSSDLTTLSVNIPLDLRAETLPRLLELAKKANVEVSKLTYDLILSGYAYRGEPDKVVEYMDEMKSKGLTPDTYSYHNLLKAHGKVKDIAASVKVVQDMQALDIKPTLPLYTTLMETCIKVHDFDQAFSVFSMMKFLSTDVNPDTHVYNSIIFAAAKSHNIEKALDLYREMLASDIEPNIDTYNNLIYTCARSPKTHIRAWELLLEMQEKGFTPTRKTLNSLLYLCGCTGELSFARTIFQRLCSSTETYPDSYAITCLFKAYASFKPGFFSPVLATSVGPKLRAAFLFNIDQQSASEPGNKLFPPFLPVPMLTNKHQILAESRAIFTFLKQHHNDLINEKNLYAYLSIPAQVDHEAEFRYRWTHETSVSLVPTHEDDKRFPRSHHLYTLAINAYADNKWSHKHAKGLWDSRGEWRRLENSVFRKEMSPIERAHSDFLFARAMVKYLANVNLLQDAVDLVKSTKDQFVWKKAYVLPAIEKAREIEDIQSEKVLLGIVAANYRDD